MIYGDNPLKISGYMDALGLNTYTYIPNIYSIRQSSNLYVYCMNNPIMFRDPNGEFAWFVPILIGGAVGAIVGGTVQIITNEINGDDWYDDLGMAMLAGGVSGSISCIPIPGLAQMMGTEASAFTSAVVMGGVGNVVANYGQSEISSLSDLLTSFNLGAAAGGLGYGASESLFQIADSFWSQLNRTEMKTAIKKLGGVSQAQVNVVLKKINNNITDNIYRQLIKDYGQDVVLAATVSSIATDVYGLPEGWVPPLPPGRR